MFPRVIDQPHVLDAGRACRHAREARQASVDMAYRAAVRRAAVFKHFLDQVDPAPWTVEFIAYHLVGRACRIAHSAMNARPDDLVGAADFRDCQLICSEPRLHASAAHQPGVENAARIEHFLQCRRNLLCPSGPLLKRGKPLPGLVVCPNERSVPLVSA